MLHSAKSNKFKVSWNSQRILSLNVPAFLSLLEIQTNKNYIRKILTSSWCVSSWLSEDNIFCSSLAAPDTGALLLLSEKVPFRLLGASPYFPYKKNCLRLLEPSFLGWGIIRKPWPIPSASAETQPASHFSNSFHHLGWPPDPITKGQRITLYRCTTINIQTMIA